MFNSITAFFTAIANFFKLKEVKAQKQVETLGIKEYKKHDKALEIAEKIIELVEHHAYFNTVANGDRFYKFAKHFRSLK